MATEQTVLAVIRASRPSFRSRHDKAAFAVHATFVAVGYVLHATGPPAFTEDAFSSSTTDEVGLDSWNEVEENYAFIYSNPEKGSKKVLVKCLVMNDSLLIDVLKEGDSEEALHLEIDVTEYVNENGGTNYGSQFKNLGKLVAELNKEILAKLDGSPGTSSSSQPSRSEPSLRDDRAQTGEGGYFPEGPRGVVPPIAGFGGSDLYPGPGAGMYPRGDFGGGGMLIGPNDPRFFGPGIGGPGLSGGLPGGVPPGARFDPYGPPGVPGFEPDRFIRRPRRPGGGGLHPDLEQFHDGSDFI